ncbi:MAG: beta-ketoacyl-[acyl-carrier-protein] synthase family protein [Phycisphaerales bacterium]|nr:MAG: beta-ketoacyl-[acyl-carrier-protein] synthase family protein [Phycisphaerales bacterium]
MKDERRVVVTGLGVATPIGIGIEAFWDALISKQCGIRRIESFDPSGFPTQIGGELPLFKLADFIPKSYRKSAKVMARDITIALACAYHAVTDAGLRTKCIIERGETSEPPNIDSTRLGANIGAGLICADLQELASALSSATDDDDSFSLKHWGSEGMGNLTPLWLLKFLPNMLACHVTIVHDAQAPSNTITCAEASSHLAIGEAYRTIARGGADACICGGAESKINPMSLARQQLWERLNIEDNETPDRACRPFAEGRCGSVVSEGGGLVILEALDHALARKAKIYAEVVGFGAGGNASSWSKPDPEGKALALAMRKALADADTSAEEIQLAAPLGTGLVDYDAAELAAWNNVFGNHSDEMHALTTRGTIGNNGAGAGGIDFAAAVQSIYQKTVPPSVNTDHPDPQCRMGFVHNDPVDANIHQGLTVGYALAGVQCAAIVIREFEE